VFVRDARHAQSACLRWCAVNIEIAYFSPRSQDHVGLATAGTFAWPVTLLPLVFLVWGRTASEGSSSSRCSYGHPEERLQENSVLRVEQKGIKYL